MGPSELSVCGSVKVMVYPVCGVAEQGSLKKAPLRFVLVAGLRLWFTLCVVLLSTSHSHIVGPSDVCLWKG